MNEIQSTNGSKHDTSDTLDQSGTKQTKNIYVPDYIDTIFQRLDAQDVERFYKSYLFWSLQPRLKTLHTEIETLQQALHDNELLMQKMQISAIALASLAQLQASGVNDLDLLDRMLDRGETWLDHTMQLLEHCEELDLIGGDYTQWCEHALEGAYDWIESLKAAKTPHNETELLADALASDDEQQTEFQAVTEEQLLKKLMSDGDPTGKLPALSQPSSETEQIESPSLTRKITRPLQQPEQEVPDPSPANKKITQPLLLIEAFADTEIPETPPANDIEQSAFSLEAESNALEIENGALPLEVVNSTLEIENGALPLEAVNSTLEIENSAFPLEIVNGALEIENGALPREVVNGALEIENGALPREVVNGALPREIVNRKIAIQKATSPLDIENRKIAIQKGAFPLDIENGKLAIKSGESPSTLEPAAQTTPFPTHETIPASEAQQEEPSDILDATTMVHAVVTRKKALESVIAPEEETEESITQKLVVSRFETVKTSKDADVQTVEEVAGEAVVSTANLGQTEAETLRSRESSQENRTMQIQKPQQRGFWSWLSSLFASLLGR